MKIRDKTYFRSVALVAQEFGGGQKIWGGQNV